MASQADYFKVEKKKKEQPEGTTAREKAAREGAGGQEEYYRAKARETAQQATGAARLQESEANKGSYAGLGLADRAAAERMVRSGEAKTRDEAAALLRKKKKKPTAGTQAGALEE